MNSWCQSCPRLHCATGHSIKYQVDARFHYNPRSPKRSQDWCVANKIECEQLNCRKWIALSGCLCVCLLVIKRNNVVQLHVDTADNHKIGPPSSLTTLTKDPLYVGGIPGRLERTDAPQTRKKKWHWAETWGLSLNDSDICVQFTHKVPPGIIQRMSGLQRMCERAFIMVGIKPPNLAATQGHGGHVKTRQMTDQGFSRRFYPKRLPSIQSILQ